LILRISPDGGGGGNELVMLRNNARPVFQINNKSTTPTPTQMMVENAGMVLSRKR
jgi:hypothetical protein